MDMYFFSNKKKNSIKNQYFNNNERNKNKWQNIQEEEGEKAQPLAYS